MRMWIDTEFNGFRGELISMAIVSEDGSEFYEYLGRCHGRLDPWVAANVLPVINKEGPVEIPELRQRLQAFLMQFDSVHLIADWPEDIAHFCRMLLTDKPGERIDTPPLTMEIVRYDAGSACPHNALSDARGMREHHLRLTSVCR